MPVVKALDIISPRRLQTELARRGLNGREFCRVAKLREATFSQATSGRPLSAGSIIRIVTTLQAIPVLGARDD